MPDISDEEFSEAKWNLKNYMTTIAQIYDRIYKEVRIRNEQDPQELLKTLAIFIAYGIDLSKPPERSREENILELMDRPALALRLANVEEKRGIVSSMLKDMTLKDKKLNATVAPPFDKWQKPESNLNTPDHTAHE